MKNKKMSNLFAVIALVIIIAMIAMLGYGYYQKATMEVVNPVATIEVKDFGTIKVELYPEIAPNTVANFVTLANRGFYDELTFHRIVKDFMIQGGDPEGTGSGGPKLSDLMDNPEEDKQYAIKGEFISNGFNKNTLKHEEGVISMARSDYTSYSPDLAEESYNSAGSQFYIMTEKNTSLDGYYTPFGKVIEGLDVLYKIEGVEVKEAEKSEDGTEGEASTPVNPPVITSIRVDTFGVDYGLPETLDVFDYYKWMSETYGIDPSAFGGSVDATEGTEGTTESTEEAETTTTEE